ncbi:dihydroneopterin aldolase [Kordiimonas aquimaris]|uniref:dihydroneopterin aldolase n=1 Tax=Kordiimonas aquimaris TaxID=707591 RepID=UPI0021CE947C|nr:dihydroneopterin aldolase [Kordiimonas aquimaris]
MPYEETDKSTNVVHFSDSRERTRRVFVHDYVTQAEIGVWSHEKGKTQAVRITVDLVVHEHGEHHGDQLEKVVCYNEIVIGIRRIIEAGHINLVETLAEKIADMTMQNSSVMKARVMVEKLEAVPEAGSVGVEIERER